MENQTNKSLEFKFVNKDVEYVIKVLIVSAEEDLEIKNIEKLVYEEFTFIISVLSYPELPKDLVNNSVNLIYILENGGQTRIGYLHNSSFIECDNNIFIRTLKAHILEVLLLSGDDGHYQQR
ncbi:hypothetical protein QQY79_04120 [Flavobacterium tructae]|uniref:hypothetical protein n=1 Tax=Flavobacterium tructae TaxID=1114873 RepID=UPI002551D63E|nr:hypothetical protein [Flavobacterium tructae]MDL2141695.1 hypothetical protein [Flavobacterium tructae]